MLSYYAIDRLPPAHYRHALPWPADKPDPDRRAGEQSKPVTPCNFFGPFRALRHELLTKGREPQDHLRSKQEPGSPGLRDRSPSVGSSVLSFSPALDI
ncbi:hypothetical protein MGG_17415 [Pyricularia oryzae 70-15]|uniref:Uncharacterized protein n=3 Tax=Pyricularia oryzae TaxID=318829 RepID=G4NB87_PYRO7|nr:uncharacterized protein MGG_17415 [Pyricularia oryzae 70-15]EHA48849.1 hypothetical protein MGG_17415 [Pyricularia oryzae 70-15]ELQ38749.1 hypothetical protein OOU_Y34scaffold00528g41 [Pyricularia oryzae Y34]